MVKEKEFTIFKNSIKICLDSEGFDQKPKKKDTVAISRRIAKQTTVVTLEELMKSITLPNAQTFTPAYFQDGKRLNEKWAGQQVFALDIDGGLQIDEGIKLSEEMKVSPTFIYSSFSHSEDQHKFRMVFLLNEEIRDARVRKVIQTSLTTLFPMADRNANDEARLLFGGQKIEYTSNSVLTVPQLLDAVVRKIKKGTNSSREMKKFCDTTNLGLYKGYPHYKVINDGDTPNSGGSIYVSLNKNHTKPINYYRTRAEISHYDYYLVFNEDTNFDGKYFDDIFKEEDAKLIRNFPFMALNDRCKLYRECTSGKYWLYHHEMFGLMTNLLNIEGGRSKVIDIINSRKEYLQKKEDWSLMMNQIKKMNYVPSRCDSFCPFAGECTHAKNMIEQGKLPRGSVQVLEEPTFQEIDTVYSRLETLFKDILNKEEKGVYVIKAPTGIGKTEVIINNAKEINFSVAFPTHKLKDEVSQRLKKQNVKHFKVPELPMLEAPFSEKIEHLYTIGAYKAVNKYLRKLSSDSDEVRLFLEELDEIKKVKDEILLTTHQRGIYTNDNSNSTIIFDEDPIPSLFPISQMRLSELFYTFTKLQENQDNKDVIMALQKMIFEAPLDVVHERSSFLLPSVKEMENTIIEDPNIHSDILGFLNCDYFIKKRVNDKEWIYFINRNQLPENKKIIILSATVNEQISQLVFGNNVQFFDLGQVKPKGSMLQVTSKSFSRYTVKENQKELEKLAKNLVEQFNPGSEIITYKDFFQIEREESLYFGNTEGIDSLKGQNITVIGTPHINPIAYLLIGVCLGFRMGLEESRMEYRQIERNGLRFYFTTYNGESLLREIQFYLIESQLLQAIGRARVNRYPAKVLILSNLPVLGADYISFSQNELQGIMK
ncbi:MAG: hypothetical protein ACQEW2_17635 [Bacillota bacterium]